MDLPAVDVDRALAALQAEVVDAQVNTIDGVKFDLEHGWVHLRKSNTEPIIRIYAEAPSSQEAQALVDRFKGDLKRQLASLEGPHA